MIILKAELEKKVAKLQQDFTQYQALSLSISNGEPKLNEIGDNPLEVLLTMRAFHFWQTGQKPIKYADGAFLLRLNLLQIPTDYESFKSFGGIDDFKTLTWMDLIRKTCNQATMKRDATFDTCLFISESFQKNSENIKAKMEFEELKILWDFTIKHLNRMFNTDLSSLSEPTEEGLKSLNRKMGIESAITAVENAIDYAFKTGHKQSLPRSQRINMALTLIKKGAETYETKNWDNPRPVDRDELETSYEISLDRLCMKAQLFRSLISWENDSNELLHQLLFFIKGADVLSIRKGCPRLVASGINKPIAESGLIS